MEGELESVEDVEGVEMQVKKNESLNDVDGEEEVERE